MLYSICSMPFWINKSNLVCADQGCSLVSVIWTLPLGTLHLPSCERTVFLSWNLRPDYVVGVGGGLGLGYQKVVLHSFDGPVCFFLSLIFDAYLAYLCTNLVHF